MKYLLLVTSVFLVAACGKSGDHAGHNQDKDVADDPNRVLYDQVMEIHDEVMPKMEDIYKLKQELQDQISNSPGMVDEKRKELERIIANLDSTNDAMMDWMHKFNPLPDSVDQEKAREYLETEIERIKKVRDQTNEAIEKAKGAAAKK